MGVLGQAALWLLCGAIIGIVVLWEKRPLSSLWFRPLQWQTAAWAGVLIALHYVVLFPATEWIRQSLGLPGYAGGMEVAVAYPLWLRVFAVITAGIVEETLYRGFAVTRILELTGSRLWAIVVPSAVFAALHLPMWGTGPSLAFFIGGLATTAFFVWRRDLVAMMIAHAAMDGWAFLVTPSFGAWWS